MESGVPAPSTAPLANERPAPAFSFLREARPLFGGRETLAEPGIAAQSSIPFQAAAPKLAAEAGGPPTPGLPSGLGAAESAFPVYRPGGATVTHKRPRATDAHAVEGMNNKIKSIRHRSFGFRSAENFIAAMLRPAAAAR